MERTFTNGARTEVARTPADAVRLRFDGWRECEAPSADAPPSSTDSSTDDESPANADDSSTDREDDTPDGTTDDQ